MIKNGIVLFIIFAFFMYCEGPTGPKGENGIDGKNGYYDRQIRLNIFDVWTSISTEWELTPQTLHLIKFNKMNYTDVDSILFVALLYVHEESDSNNACHVKLYNVTDSVDIDNAEISSALKNFFSALSRSFIFSFNGFNTWSRFSLFCWVNFCDFSSRILLARFVKCSADCFCNCSISFF